MLCVCGRVLSSCPGRSPRCSGTPASVRKCAAELADDGPAPMMTTSALGFNPVVPDFGADKLLRGLGLEGGLHRLYDP